MFKVLASRFLRESLKIVKFKAQEICMFRGYLKSGSLTLSGNYLPEREGLGGIIMLCHYPSPFH